MKTTCLLFLTMSWAALTQGTGYAVPSSPASRCKLEKSSGANAVPPPRCAESLWLSGQPSTSSQHRLDGAAFQTRLRRFLTYRRYGKASLSAQRGGRAAGQHHQASDEQRDHGRASDPNHPPSRASLTKANRPKQLPNSRQRSIPGNALHQPGSDKSGGAAKSGFIRNETVNNALAVRTPSVVRPTVPSLNNVRHRSPNPAVVGGSPNSHSSNTGAINGTRMNRKP